MRKSDMVARRESSVLFAVALVLSAAVWGGIVLADKSTKTLCAEASNASEKPCAAVQTAGEEGNEVVTFAAVCPTRTPAWVRDVYLEQSMDGGQTWERLTDSPTWTQCGPYPTPGLSYSTGVKGGAMWRAYMGPRPTGTIPAGDVGITSSLSGRNELLTLSTLTPTPTPTVTPTGTPTSTPTPTVTPTP